MWESFFRKGAFIQVVLIFDILSVSGSDSERFGDDKIIGGRVATNIPFVVSIQIFNKHVCGGSLLTLVTTLTACHCVGDYVESKNNSMVEVLRLDATKKYSILAGEWDLDIKSFRQQTRSVKSMFAHPACVRIDGNIQWDFAIITVTKSFDETDFVKPSELFSLVKSTFDERIEQYQGKKRACWVMGWGKPDTDQNSQASSRLLRAVKMKIITDEDCQYYLSQQNPVYFNYSFVDRAQMCAVGLKWEESDCTGDSGGPVYCKGYILGTVSYGFECGRGDHPAVYTRLSDFVGWYNSTRKAYHPDRSTSSYSYPSGWAFGAILLSLFGLSY